jgi:hypothetical protein
MAVAESELVVYLVAKPIESKFQRPYICAVGSSTSTDSKLMSIEIGNKMSASKLEIDNITAANTS